MNLTQSVVSTAPNEALLDQMNHKEDGSRDRRGTKMTNLERDTVGFLVQQMWYLWVEDTFFSSPCEPITSITLP